VGVTSLVVTYLQTASYAISTVEWLRQRAILER